MSEPPEGKGLIRTIKRIPVLCAVFLIKFYQMAISPHFPSCCRFVPTCSEYGYEAIGRHGLWSGGWLTLFRVGRCGPGGTWGYDPVPETLDQRYRWWAPCRYFQAGRKRPHGEG